MNPANSSPAAVPAPTSFAKSPAKCRLKWLVVALFVVLALAVIGIPLLVLLLKHCRFFGDTPCDDDNATLAWDTELRRAHEDTAVHRLPSHLIAEHYWLELKTYVPSTTFPRFSSDLQFMFFGKVEIMFLCISASTNVTVNALKLNIDREGARIVALTDSGEESEQEEGGVDITSVEDRQHADQQVVVWLSAPLRVGAHYKLALNFSGLINDELNGLYRSSYREKGQKKWLAVTQFQATYARRAFPCFDEPSQKAAFTVALIHPESTSAQSNTIEEGVESLGGGWSRTRFGDSPKMSTYLVAFLISEFKHVESRTSRGTLFRIWAQPEMLNQTDLAANAGPKMMDYFEEYFAIPFPLEKQDMVAIPDFDAGAMENWGLITYRDVYLLYSPQTSTSKTQQNVLQVVAHELAHQWFGNLVTMDWWNDLWLNEGFATYLEYDGVAHCGSDSFPMSEQFPFKSVQQAMSSDELPSHHALRVTVDDPMQILSIFDHITYDKGASIIRMLGTIAGKDKLRRSLRQYLKGHLYATASASDLWRFVHRNIKSNKEILPPGQTTAELMKCWVQAKGFPVIQVITDPQRTHVTLEQRPFLLFNYLNYTINADNMDPEECNKGWMVPIWFKQSQDRRTHLEWLLPNKKLTIPYRNDEWLMINPEARGFYRVQYDDISWKRIQDQLMKDHRVFTVESRSQIIDDLFALAKTSTSRYGKAMSALLYMKRETSLVPWETAIQSLAYLHEMLNTDPRYTMLERYAASLVEPLFLRLGAEMINSTENMLERQLRSSVWKLACSLKLSACLSASQKLYRQLRHDCAQENVLLSSSCNQISPNLREAVYCAILSKGLEEDFDFFLEKGMLDYVSMEKWTIWGALPCTNNWTAVSALLDLTLELDSYIRKPESGWIFEQVSTNSHLAGHLWPYFVKNWRRIRIRFSDSQAIVVIFRAVTKQLFKTKREFLKMTAFVRQTDAEFGAVKEMIMHTMIINRYKVDWYLAGKGEEIFQWLKETQNKLLLL